MNRPDRRYHERRKPQFTPENTKAWTLAMYPAAVFVVVAFMIITDKPITTEIIGLLVGLLTAGSLQAVIKKNGVSNADPNDVNDSRRRIRDSSDKELENGDRRRPDDPDRRSNYSVRVWGREIQLLPNPAQRIRLLSWPSGTIRGSLRF